MNIHVSTSRGLFSLQSMNEDRWCSTVPFKTEQKGDLNCRAKLADNILCYVYPGDKAWESAPFDVLDFGVNRYISRRMAEPDGSEMQFTGYIGECHYEDEGHDLRDLTERYKTKWAGKFLDQTPLPVTSEERKKVPLASIFDFFPLAMVELAKCIYVGNEKHNQGNPIEWQREKSSDHSDCLLRHFMERGYTDTDGIQHSTKVAWRALAILQLELEKCTDKKPSTF